MSENKGENSKSKLFEKIEKDLRDAMVAKEATRADILKMVVSDLKKAQIAKTGDELTEEEVVKVVQSHQKRLKEAAEAFENAGREDQAKREQEQLSVVEVYLPKQLGEDEVREKVRGKIEELGAEGMQDMGKVMGALMAELKGEAQGEMVNRLVKEELAG